MYQYLRGAVAAPVLAAVLAVPAVAQENEKLADDPTKIVTKLGASYTDYGTISGSIAFGPVSKLNMSYSETGEWRFGGSYLFDFGIVNFSASKNELSTGTVKTGYAVGTYVPLEKFGFAPAGWTVFGTGGVNYTEGETASVDVQLTDGTLVTTTSKGIYAGLFGLKPLSEDWTLRGAAVASLGSDDYRGYTVGGGITYHLTEKDTIGAFAVYSDNTLGSKESIGISYNHEF